MSKPISLTQQIDEVEREIKYRENVYPRLVAKGSMRQAIADYQLARMKAVLATLKWLREHELEIKAAAKQWEKAGS